MGLSQAMCTKAAVQVARESLFSSSGEHFGYWIRAVHRDGDSEFDCCEAVTELLTSAPASAKALTAGWPAVIDVQRPMLDGRMRLPRVEPRVLLNLPAGAILDPQLVPAIEAQAIRGRRFCVPAADLLLGGTVPGGSGSVAVFDLAVETEQSLAVALTSLSTALPPGRFALAAVHVDDSRTFQRCVEQGFSILHGRRPGQVLGARAAAGILATHTIALQSVARLADPEVALDQVVNLLSSDQHLTARLLKWASSAATGWGRRVESVREAITVIGLARLRAWMVMATMGSLPQARHVVLDALTAARMGELLARRLAHPEPESAFTACLLQSLSASWGPTVVEALRGTDCAPAAVLEALEGADGLVVGEAKGNVGLVRVLQDVRWYQGGTASTGPGPAAGTPTSVAELRALYGQAVNWADQVAHAQD